MTNTASSEQNFSTTRLLTDERPVIEKDSKGEIETALFLPKGEDRQGEGGLRTKGYFKRSYDDRPLITVVTVVYNGEEHLEQTIKSVIEQSYDNVEYIIVDGGSSDGTLDIIKKYEDQIDYWVSESDSGIYDAMNRGISLLSGKWVNFMNAGDEFYDLDVLKKIFDSQLEKGIGVIYGDVLRRYSKDHKVIEKSKPIETIYEGMPFSHQSSFVNHAHLKRYNFNLEYKICADYDIFCRLYSENVKFLYTDCIIASYDMFGVSTNFSRSYLEKREISCKYEPTAIQYYSKRRYMVLKLKDTIKRYLPKKSVMEIKLWLSRNIYHKSERQNEQ